MIYYHQAIKDKDLAEHKGIAYPSVKQLQQAITLKNSSKVFRTGEADKNNKPLLPLERLVKMKDFIDGVQAIITGKTVTAEELLGATLDQDKHMKLYLNSAKTAANVTIQHQVYEQAKTANKFISYDIESLGGIDAFGANRFDYLTELAYTEATMDNHSLNAALENTKHYFFGIKPEEYNALLEEISAEGFYENSDRGKVLFERLAIYGHKDTVIKGNQIIKQAQLKKGEATFEMALKGLDVLLRAGKHDAATLKDGLTDGQRFMQTFMEKTKGNVVAGHNILNFDNRKMGILGYDINDAASLDTLAIYRAAAANAPKSVLLQATKTLADKTGYSQENLVSLILGEQSDLTAHNAGTDSALHSLIVSSPELKRIVEDYLPHAEEVFDVTPGRALFYSNQSNYGEHRGMSFIQLPTGEMRTGSGFTFDENAITKDLFKTSAIKKGGLYTYEGSGKMPLTEEMRKAMRDINADYAQEHLYYALLKPYAPNSTSLEANSTILQVFDSEKSMKEFMMSNDLIGVRENTTDDFVLPAGKLGQRAKEIMTKHNLETHASETLSLNDFIENQAKINEKDRPSRKIREFDLKDAKRAQKFLHAIRDDLKMDDDDFDEVASLVFTPDYKIAANMSDDSQKITTLDIDGLKKIIGHQSQQQQRLYYQTVDNLISQSAFYLNNSEVIEEVLGFVKTHYGKTSQAQQQEAYHTLMQSLTEDSIERSPLEINDLDHVEIKKDSIRSAKRSTPVKKSMYPKETLRVNLKGKNREVKLIDTLMKHRFGEQDFSSQDYNLQAKAVLQTFAKEMGIKLRAKDYGDATIYSDDILTALSDKKKNNPYFGIIDTVAQKENILDLKLSTENLQERLVAHSKSIKQIESLDPKVLAQQLIDTFNTQIKDDYFYQFGLEKKQARFMHQMHERIVEDQRAFFTQFIGEFSEIPGMEFILEGKGFYAKYGDTTVDLAKYIPQYKVHGQMSYFQIGRSQIASKSVLTVDPKELTTIVKSGINIAQQNTHYSFAGLRKTVEAGHGNPAEGIATAFSLFGEQLRKTSNIGEKNLMNRNSSFSVDDKAILSLAGIMAKKGYIKIDDPEQLKTLLRYSNDGKEAADMESVNQHYRSIAGHHLDEMLYILNKNKSENSLEYFVSANFGPYGVEGDVSEGIMNAGNASHMPHYGLGQGKRLTAHQNNFYSFNKEEATERMQEISKYNTGSAMPSYRFGAGVDTEAGFYRTNTILDSFPELNKNYSNQVVVKKARVTPEFFKLTLDAYMNEQKTDDAIREKLAQTSLLEDETIIDARLKDAFFTQTEIQKIALDKAFIESEDFKTMYGDLYYSLEKDSDGKTVFKYGKSKKVKKNDILFDVEGYQEAVDERLAYYDGQLKIGFYAEQENLFLTQDDINTLIDGKSLEDAQDYLDGLNSYFYLDPSQQERYFKVNASNVEKSKTRSIVFAPGEYNPDVANQLKEEGAEELIGSQESWEHIKAVIKEKQLSEELVQAMIEERYAADDVIQFAFGNKGIGLFTDEQSGKHGDAGAYINDILRTIQGHHLKKGYDLELMKERLVDAVGPFEFSEDGTIVFPNGKLNANMAKLEEVVQKHYKKVIAPEVLGKAKEFEESDSDRKVIILESNIAQTKEHDRISGHMPIERLPQVKKYEKEINSYTQELTELEKYFNTNEKSPSVDVMYAIKLNEEQTVRRQRLLDTLNENKRLLDEAKSKLSPFEYQANLQTLSDIDNRLNAINQQIEAYQKDIAYNVEKIVKNRTYQDSVQMLVEQNAESRTKIQHLQIKRQELLDKKNTQVAAIDVKMHALKDDIDALNDIHYKQASFEKGEAYKALAKQKREIQETINAEIRELDKEVKGLRSSITINNEEIEKHQFQLKVAGHNYEIKDINQEKRDKIKKLKKERETLTNKRTQVKADILAEKGLLKNVAKAQRVVDANAYYKDANIKKADERAEKATQKNMRVYAHEVKNKKRATEEARMRYITAYEARANGVKRDDRKFAFLRNLKYDSKLLNQMPEEMLEMLGLKDIDRLDLEGKPILEQTVKEMLYEATTSSKFNVLTPSTYSQTIDDYTSNEYLRKGLKTIYEDSGVKDVSLELIESRYLLSQSHSASAFNNNQATTEEMVEKGFEVIDVRDYTQSKIDDSDLIKKGNSIFSKDLILDVDGKKVAVPYIPTSSFGNTIVHREYESNIVKLRNAVLELDETKDQKKRNNLQGIIANTIEAIKKDNTKIIAKDGPIHERLNARSQQSARAASSSVANLYLEGNKDSAASKAMFLGKSIQEWANAGNEAAYIDAAWGSKAFFDELGINDAYLKEQFGSADRGWEHLSTYGLQGFVTRDPVLEEGSYKAARLYYDHTLEGNTLKTTHHTQISMNGDHDGDTNAFDVMRHLVNGKYVSSLELELNDMPDAFKYTNEIDRMMAINATTSNVGLASELKNAFSDKDLLKQNRRTLKEATANYQKLLDNRFGDEFIHEQLTNPYFDKDFGPERIAEIKEHVQNLSEMVPIDYESPSKTYENIQAYTFKNDEEKAMYLKDYKDFMSLQRRQNTIDTKIFKNAIGEINLPLYEMRSQAETLMSIDEITSSDFDALKEMTYALEQEVISAKNARGEVDIDATNDLKRIISAAYYNKPIDFKEHKDIDASQAIGYFIDEHVGEKRFTEKYANRTYKTGDNTYEHSKKAVQTVVSNYHDERMHKTRDYFKLFSRKSQSMEKVDLKKAMSATQDGSGLENFLFGLSAPYEEDITPINLNDIHTDNHTFKHAFSDREVMADIAENAEKRSNKQMSLLEHVGKSPQSGKAMAGFALAGIGAYLMMGAVGNSVTANTTNQAEQFQGDTLSDYGSDYSIQEQALPQSSGYVINVNAKANPDTVQKIAGQFNQSIASSVNANLTMTMNINEMPLKQFQINSLVEHTLFNQG